jgi:putative N6-adenine-specific DNA methylase
MNKFFIICPPGLETICRHELAHKITILGLEPFQIVSQQEGGFELEMEKNQLAQVIAYLKTPTRILQRLTDFKARDYPKLFQKLAKIEWKQYLYSEHIEFKVTCRESRLIHTDRVASTAQDAIEKYFKAYPHKKTIQEKLKNDQQILYIRAMQDQFYVSLDLTGHRMDQRDENKPEGFVAPLRRSIASAMLFQISSLYSKQELKLLDPFTGSGTFTQEALSFYHPQQLNSELFSHPFEMFSMAKNTMKQRLFQQYMVSDLTDFADLKGDKLAGIDIKIEKKSFFDYTSVPTGTVIVVNPPYNKRIQINNPIEFYSKIISKAQSIRALALAMIFPEEYAPTILKDRICYETHVLNGGIKCLFRIWDFSNQMNDTSR